MYTGTGLKNINIQPDYAMDSQVDFKEVVVIDNGSDLLKIGFSGDDWPQITMPSVMGIQRTKMSETDHHIVPKVSYFYGNDVNDNIPNLEVYNPIVEGKIDNWDNMTKYWTYVLENRLNLDLTTVNLLIIDPPMNDKEYKKELADRLFEEVKVASILFMNSSILSLFATGQTTGFVVESGHGFTSTLPIFEGYPLNYALNSSRVAGKDIDQKLLEGLLEREIKLDTKRLDTKIVIKDIKEKVLSMALNYESQMNSADSYTQEERSYELPDNKIIEIDHPTRYTASEVLYRPSLVNSSDMPLHKMFMDSMYKCDPGLQIELYKNIVFSGGTTLLKGFVERLSYEVNKELASAGNRSIVTSDIKWVAETNRRFAAWIGGSMLGSLSVFQSQAITKAEYEENADAKLGVIHKKTL